jgi:hypothetical protein
LQVQEYRGRPVLTWFEGEAFGGYGEGEFVIADESYREIGRVRAGNGYEADLHDVVLTPEGTALFMIYDLVIAEPDVTGEARARPVFDAVVQEVDVETGVVLFEWHALDDVPLSDAYQPPPEDPAEAYDYIHVNSVAEDADGDILVSARHTAAVYSLDRETGALEWTLGGRSSDFEMGPGSEFAWQHDARRQPDGVLSLFDNAASNVDDDAAESRLLLLDVDESARTATVLAAYGRDVLSRSQGNAQRLPNGNYVVGWGDRPLYTEFTRDGRVVYEARLPAADDEHVVNSYRAFRYPWSGDPVDRPVVVAHDLGGSAAVYASWNGATEVETWEVLGGAGDGTLAPLATAPRDGFETRVVVTPAPPVVQVRALDAAGEVLGTSEPEPPVPPPPAPAGRVTDR